MEREWIAIRERERERESTNVTEARNPAQGLSRELCVHVAWQSFGVDGGDTRSIYSTMEEHVEAVLHTRWPQPKKNDTTPHSRSGKAGSAGGHMLPPQCSGPPVGAEAPQAVADRQSCQRQALPDRVETGPVGDRQSGPRQAQLMAAAAAADGSQALHCTPTQHAQPRHHCSYDTGAGLTCGGNGAATALTFDGYARGACCPALAQSHCDVTGRLLCPPHQDGPSDNDGSSAPPPRLSTREGVDICVLLCGLNDFKQLWKGRTATVFRQDLGLLLQRIRAFVGQVCLPHTAHAPLQGVRGLVSQSRLPHAWTRATHGSLRTELDGPHMGASDRPHIDEPRMGASDGPNMGHTLGHNQCPRVCMN